MKQLLEMDARASARLRVAEQPGWRRNAAALLARSGDSWFWLLGLVAVWWLGDMNWRSWAQVQAIAILITAGLVMVIKFTVRRRRPEGEWGGIYRSTDPHSFPSGHAARAVMLAVLAQGLGPVWFAILLSIWAPLVVLARVAMGLHYLSDVLAGALLGSAAGVLFLFVLL